MNHSSALDVWLQTAAASFGTPSYVYLASAIESRAALLRQAFEGRFALSFAAKSNPNPALLSLMRGQAEYLDVSSIGEFRTALAAGWEAARISFTGPGKRQFEIREAIEGDIGELILESVREAVLANSIAAELGRIQHVRWPAGLRPSASTGKMLRETCLRSQPCPISRSSGCTSIPARSA
jgi:diaminopimelate decarboxylase